MRKILLPGVALIVLFLFAGAASAQSVSIQLESGAFKLVGWKTLATPPANGWASVFSVYAGAGDVPAMLGTYSTEGGTLVFRPQFPLAPGVRYRAVFQPPGGARIEATFDGPRQETTPTTRVAHVYPSASVLPSNDLKLYIYFSAPMIRGEAWQHIHLLDESGKPLPRVFLELGQELWDSNFQRLTVLFDPGRIKRGVVSRETMGPPIVAGKNYTLVIDRDWKDARGVRLVEGFRKPFRGGPEDRNPPDPKQWRISAPKAGSSEPLVVTFPKAMDYALLQRVLTVSIESGGNVSGAVNVVREETEWRFTPRDPWKAGAYKLVVDTNIEDLCGNKIGHPFDLDNIDAFNQVTQHITTKMISLPFSIR